MCNFCGTFVVDLNLCVMKKLFFSLSCLLAVTMVLTGCKDSKDEPAIYATHAEVAFTVLLSCDDVPDCVTNLNEIELTIHYLDADGKEQTKPVKQDGENVTIKVASFPATYNFYVTGKLIDESKDKYNFGISVKKSIQLYMNDGSKGSSFYPAVTGFGSTGIQKDRLVDDYLPKLKDRTVFGGKFNESGGFN